MRLVLLSFLLVTFSTVGIGETDAPITSSEPSDTPIPTMATEAPNATIEVDIMFSTFSETRTDAYLALLTSALGVPSVRMAPVLPRGKAALEFGTSYIFSVRVADPSGVGTDTDSAVALADRAVELINNESLITDAVRKSTMHNARRVHPEMRLREAFAEGVNQVWVAFLLAAAVMLAASAYFLFLRKRDADEEVIVTELYVPPETKEDPREQLVAKVASLRSARLPREEKWQMRDEGGPSAFEATMLYDHAFALPPQHTGSFFGDSSAMHSNSLLIPPNLGNEEDDTDAEVDRGSGNGSEVDL